ncbi:hypothetical protein LR066_03305 [candidate division WOR-3 bacterium]|nr:hypothetical protein [candidate division WOR-3 bacterium]
MIEATADSGHTAPLRSVQIPRLRLGTSSIRRKLYGMGLKDRKVKGSIEDGRASQSNKGKQNMTIRQFYNYRIVQLSNSAIEHKIDRLPQRCSQFLLDFIQNLW